MIDPIISPKGTEVSLPSRGEYSAISVEVPT